MNKVASKKTVVKHSRSQTPSEKKKDKYECPIIKKPKCVRRAKARQVKKVIRNVNLLNEWAENESSRPEIYESPKLRSDLKNASSTESVIYVGSYRKFDKENTPIIDLTHSSSVTLEENYNTAHSKILRTLYFPSRNFDRKIKLRKSIATTSLITLPVIKKQKISRKLNSMTVLNTVNEKLNILDIPKQYMDELGVNSDFSLIEKAKLNSSDYKMIDWILDVERDLSLSPTTSGYDSSLNTDTSIENVCNKGDVNTKNKIDQP